MIKENKRVLATQEEDGEYLYYVETVSDDPLADTTNSIIEASDINSYDQAKMDVALSQCFELYPSYSWKLFDISYEITEVSEHDSNFTNYFIRSGIAKLNDSEIKALNLKQYQIMVKTKQ